jgi:hypothetical protein
MADKPRNRQIHFFKKTDFLFNPENRHLSKKPIPTDFHKSIPLGSTVRYFKFDFLTSPNCEVDLLRDNRPHTLSYVGPELFDRRHGEAEEEDKRVDDQIGTLSACAEQL